MQPPVRLARACTHLFKRNENPPGDVFGDQSSGLGLQLASDEKVRHGELGAKMRGAEINVDDLAVEVHQFRIMRGHEPCGFRAKGDGGLLEGGDETPLILQGLGKGEQPDARPALEIDLLPAGPIAVSGEVKIKLLRASQERLLKLRGGLFDNRASSLRCCHDIPPASVIGRGSETRHRRLLSHGGEGQSEGENRGCMGMRHYLEYSSS